MKKGKGFTELDEITSVVKRRKEGSNEISNRDLQ